MLPSCLYDSLQLEKSIRRIAGFVPIASFGRSCVRAWLGRLTIIREFTYQPNELSFMVTGGAIICLKALREIPLSKDFCHGLLFSPFPNSYGTVLVYTIIPITYTVGVREETVKKPIDALQRVIER